MFLAVDYRLHETIEELHDGNILRILVRGNYDVSCQKIRGVYSRGIFILPKLLVIHIERWEM